MSESSAVFSLPPARKNSNRKGNLHQHPLVAACMRPRKTDTAQCQECGMTFSQKKFLLKHRIEVHGEKAEWQCKECGMILSSKYVLEGHMDKHRNAKKYKCPVCPAAFNSRASQKRHFLYKHTEERPHQCSLCDFATVEHSKLLIHLRNHTGESPYVCSTCGMTFKIPIAYKRHLLVHKGWRLYLCPFCLQKFGTSVTVKQHMWTSHGIPRQTLCPIRSVLNDGMPVMLSKFLEDVKLGEPEKQMVNSLKYFEVQKAAEGNIKIENDNLSVFNKFETNKHKINFYIDKSLFFKLDSKHPACHRSRSCSPNNENFIDSVEETEIYQGKKRNSNEENSEIVAEISGALDQEENIATSGNIVNSDQFSVEGNKKQVGKETKTKRKRKGQSKAKATSKSNENDDAVSLQLADEEAVKVLERIQAEDTAVGLTEPEVKIPRRNKYQSPLSKEKSTLTNSVSNDDTNDSDNKESILDNPVFVNQERKSFSLKTPRLTNSASNVKENTADKTVSPAYCEIDMEQQGSSEPVSQDPEYSKTNTVQTTAVEIIENEIVTNEPSVCHDEIPYPTNFISVVTETANSAEAKVSNITVPPIDNNDSNTSFQSLESGLPKEIPLKSLPPFISLKKCSPAHQERLLIGMKKGVFGPTPSVVRVLEDGSMINVSNLYKTYLPPAPVSQKN